MIAGGAVPPSSSRRTTASSPELRLDDNEPGKATINSPTQRGPRRGGSSSGVPLYATADAICDINKRKKRQRSAADGLDGKTASKGTRSCVAPGVQQGALFRGAGSRSPAGATRSS